MTPDTNRQAWVDAGWLIEHTGGGCEALTRYYRHPGGLLAVVLTADLAVPDAPDDEYIDPLGVYLDNPDVPADEQETGWGVLLHDESTRVESTYHGWRRLADVLATMHGAVQDVTYPITDPYRGAGLAPDMI